MAWPSMRDDVDQPLAALGVLLLVGTAGYLATSASLGALARRVPAGTLLAGSGALGAVGMAGFAAAPGWALLVAAALAFGAAGGVLDGGLNAAAALRHGPATLNLLHAGFGAGAALGPLLVSGLLVAGASWRWAFVVLGLVYGGLGLGCWRTRRAWVVAAPPPDGGPAPAGPRPSRLPLVLGAATFFVYVGVEVAAGQWAYSLLTEGRGFAEGTAGTCVALYWGALTAGRLAVAAAGRRTNADVLLLGATVAAVAGAALLWWAPVDAAGPVALAVLGLALAPVFPTLVAATPARIGADRTASAVGVQVAAGGLGGGVLPLAVGVVMDRTTLEALGPSLLAGAVLLLVLQRAAARSATPPSLSS